jgi:hypothetical protein
LLSAEQQLTLCEAMDVLQAAGTATNTVSKHWAQIIKLSKHSEQALGADNKIMKQHSLT